MIPREEKYSLGITETSLKITKSDLSLKICFPLVELFLKFSIRGKYFLFLTSRALLGSGTTAFQSCLKRRD